LPCQFKKIHEAAFKNPASPDVPVPRAPGIAAVIYSCPPAAGNDTIFFFSRETSSVAKEPAGWQPVALPPPAALKRGLQCVTDLKLAPPYTP